MIVAGASIEIFAGGISDEVTPVPIPNTEVKLICAHGTAWATGWESRTSPAFIWARASICLEARVFHCLNVERRIPLFGQWFKCISLSILSAKEMDYATKTTESCAWV